MILHNFQKVISYSDIPQLEIKQHPNLKGNSIQFSWDDDKWICGLGITLHENC